MMPADIRRRMRLLFLAFFLLVSISSAAIFWTIETEQDALVINLAGRQQMLPEQMTTEALLAETEENPRAVYRLNPAWLQPGHDLVNRSEISSTQKLVRLRWIQIFFFCGATLLLMIGFLSVQKSLVIPLNKLGLMTKRISDGDLSAPVALSGAPEIEMLAHNLDSIRTQLMRSRTELRVWTKKFESCVAQRTYELTSAFEISQEITAQLDLAHLLPSIIDRAQALTQARSATLCLLTPDGAYLKPVTRSGEMVTAQRNLYQPVEQGVAKQVIGRSQTVTTTGPTCLNCFFLRSCASSEYVATPLRVGEQTLGALCVARPTDRPFAPDETQALTLLANSAAIAIANARLVEVERRQTEQAAILAERERLATEFHDHLAQMLSFLNFKADRLLETLVNLNIDQAKVELNRMKSTIDEAYTQVRIALTALREPITAEDDLIEQIEAYLADFREQSNLSVKLDVDNPETLILTDRTQRQALLIVREALANIWRHAQAQQVWVNVICDPLRNEVCFVIRDDGSGFDTNVKGENHLGLKIMRMRAERSDGRLNIESAPGAGTKVAAYFPLASYAAKNGK